VENRKCLGRGWKVVRWRRVDVQVENARCLVEDKIFSSGGTRCSDGGWEMFRWRMLEFK
jgi:hypothetical protein